MKLKKLIPGYGWLALFLVLGTNFLVYCGSRLFTTTWHHYDLTLDIDNHIPFIKEFILVYIILAYIQWTYGYFLVLREEKRICFRICIADIVAKLLCLVFFLIIPTTMTRAHVTGNDFFSRCMVLMYSIDPPDNLFPSIHCLESYLLMRVLPLMKKAPTWYRLATPPASILVMISTLLVKQHVIVDIIGAIIVVEVGLLVSRLLCSRIKGLG